MEETTRNKWWLSRVRVVARRCGRVVATYTYLYIDTLHTYYIIHIRILFFHSFFRGFPENNLFLFRLTYIHEAVGLIILYSPEGIDFRSIRLYEMHLYTLDRYLTLGYNNIMCALDGGKKLQILQDSFSKLLSIRMSLYLKGAVMMNHYTPKTILHRTRFIANLTFRQLFYL